jgi:hypothetical protein
LQAQREWLGEGEALLRKYGNLLREEGAPGVEQIEAGLRQAGDAAAFEKHYLRAYLLLQARLNSHSLAVLLEELKGLGR